MDKDPSEALEQFVADQVREAAESVDSGVHVIRVDNGSEGARRVRAVIAFLAFVLGVSLVLKRYSMIGDGLSHVGFGALAVATALNLAPLAVTILSLIHI